MTFEEILARDGHLVYKTRGRSMEPLLRQDRDLVEIRVPGARLNRFDVALYRRGPAYVLHRVVEVRPEGYLIRGDNTFVLETVPDSAVIGVLASFVRKGKPHTVTERGYLRYVRFWNGIYPLRACWARVRTVGVHLARKLGLLPTLRRLLGRGGPRA